MEVKDVLENFTNLEKECEAARQTVAPELQVRHFKEKHYIAKIRDD